MGRPEYLKRVELLKREMWLDGGTRAMFMEAALYNQNINMYVVALFIYTKNHFAFTAVIAKWLSVYINKSTYTEDTG